MNIGVKKHSGIFSNQPSPQKRKSQGRHRRRRHKSILTLFRRNRLDLVLYYLDILSIEPMSVIPIAILIGVLCLDLANALIGMLTNFELLPELGKWTNIACAALSLIATLMSFVLLLTKKYSSILMGFMVTMLSALSFAVFTAWTASWFVN